MKRGTTHGKAQAPGRSLDPVVRRKNALYRAKLSCKIGRDALEGCIEIPANVQSIDWALFNLLHAVEEIATALEPNPKVQTEPPLGGDSLQPVVGHSNSGGGRE